MFEIRRNSMYLALTQKKDFRTEYEDKLYELYHFPAKYRSKINTGDIFIYHQGDNKQPVTKNVRYYYGTGIIGDIYSDDGGVTFFAELKQCKAFYNNVSIKNESGIYWEQIGIEYDREKPDWQNSIRNISEDAYKAIINASGGLLDVSNDIDVEAMKADLKLSIDDFYLNNNHNALADIIKMSVTLMQKYGVMVK